MSVIRVCRWSRIKVDEMSLCAALIRLIDSVFHLRLSFHYISYSVLIWFDLIWNARLDDLKSYWRQFKLNCNRFIIPFLLIQHIISHIFDLVVRFGDLFYLYKFWQITKRPTDLLLYYHHQRNYDDPTRWTTYRTRKKKPL